MAGIFISYRRSGVSTTTYRLADELKRTFGADSIFLDVESIEPGIPFAQAIQKALNQCSVALVIMGPEWLGMEDDQGNRRLNNPDDWVRQEVRLALEAGIRVIPVLVHDARMPNADELPGVIQSLSSLQAFSIMNSQTHWSFDVERLQNKIAQIDKKLAKKLNSTSSNAIGNQGFSHKSIWALALGILVLLAYSADGGFSDISEASGALLFVIIGLLLGILGFKDIHQNLKKGKAIAIGGISLCVLMMLLTFGEMGNMGNDFNPASIQPEPLEVVPEIKPDPKPAHTNISGVWWTNQGVSYQINQSGNKVTFSEYNAFGAAIGSGSGQVNQNQFSFSYYNTFLGTSGQGVGTIQGNTITINFVDQFNNQNTFQIFRQ